MNNRTLFIIYTLLLAILISGCFPVNSEPAQTSSEVESKETETTQATPASTNELESGEIEDDEAQSELFLSLEPIDLMTPMHGEGDRPLLSWKPVSGAILYEVVVKSPSGKPYWTWTGKETEVPVGGYPKLVPTAAGPRVIEGMSWTVMALDESYIPIAFGGPRPLAP